jgi:hypothetical protein
MVVNLTYWQDKEIRTPHANQNPDTRTPQRMLCPWCSSCIRVSTPVSAPSGDLARSSLRAMIPFSLKTFRQRLNALAGTYYQEGPTLVTPAWLDAKLREQPDSGRRMHVLDCTWYLPSAKKDPLDEFVRRGRLHGAKFFDLDAIADQGTTLPHMLCSPQAFGAAMDALGISTHDDVVCYDRQGIFSAPRAWWTFQAFGHHGTVSVLDGGLPAWRNEFGPEYMMETAQIDRGEVERPGRVCGSYVAGDPVIYEASLQTHLVKRLSDVVATSVLCFVPRTTTRTTQSLIIRYAPLYSVCSRQRLVRHVRLSRIHRSVRQCRHSE